VTWITDQKQTHTAGGLPNGFYDLAGIDQIYPLLDPVYNIAFIRPEVRKLQPNGFHWETSLVDVGANARSYSI
jgi:hypothetical protein